MSTAPFVLYSFASTHEALDAEALLKDMGLDVVPVPAPRTLAGMCGIALRVPPEQAVSADRFLANGGVPPAARTEVEDRVPESPSR